MKSIWPKFINWSWNFRDPTKSSLKFGTCQRNLQNVYILHIKSHKLRPKSLYFIQNNSFLTQNCSKIYLYFSWFPAMLPYQIGVRTSPTYLPTSNLKINLNEILDRFLAQYWCTYQFAAKYDCKNSLSIWRKKHISMVLF